MFCQFVGLGYPCFLHTKIKELKEQLELSLSDKKSCGKGKRAESGLAQVVEKAIDAKPNRLVRLH